VRPVSKPFLWTEEKGYRILPVPDGYDDVLGVAINNRGEILLQASLRKGIEGSENEEAGYLLSGGRLKKLPEPLKDGLTYYLDLNDRGWLAGSAAPRGKLDQMSRRGFIARPVR